MSNTTFLDPFFTAVGDGISTVLQFAGIKEETSNTIASVALFVGPLFIGKIGDVAEIGTAEEGAHGFRSFAAFKRTMGPAGEGQTWHHIVEQNPSNIMKFGPEAIHVESNLIRLPNGAGSIHAKISGYYSSKLPGTNMLLRNYVNSLSFDEQYNFGLNALKRFGH